MVDLDVFIDRLMGTPGLHMASTTPLSADVERRDGRTLYHHFEVSPTESAAYTSIWDVRYTPMTFLPISSVAATFPHNGMQGFRRWLKRRYTVVPHTSSNDRRGSRDICFNRQRLYQFIDSLLHVVPIFRHCFRHLLSRIHDDGIQYVEFRVGLDFLCQHDESDTVGSCSMAFFEVFGEKVDRFRRFHADTGFLGAKAIWTAKRKYSNREIVESMKQCIEVKKKFPHLIAGFDLLGYEGGRSLADFVPVHFWFQKRCLEENVEIPYLFHTGEGPGDSSSTDQNLHDAILLHARRLCDASSLYKYPSLSTW